MFFASTLASEHSSRWVSSRWPISRLKIRVGRFSRTAAWAAMLSANAVLPMAGRAPTMIKRVGLETGEQLVEVDEPRGGAGDALARLVELFEPVERGIEQIADLAHRVGHTSLRHLEHHVLGLVDGLGDVVGPAVADLGDLTGDLDEAAAA